MTVDGEPGRVGGEVSPAQPSRLLIGLNAAHSGSSTTYVRLGCVLERAAFDSAEKLVFSQPACPPAGAALREATIEQQGRGAGLLGARFTPDPSSRELFFSVAVGTTRGKGAQTAGLARMDAQAVFEGLREVARASSVAEFGAGRLEVHWAMTHAVDSSAYGFRELAGRLVAIMALPAGAPADAVWQAWRRQAESARLGRVLDYLEALQLQRPDSCDFRPGATEAELARVEERLGLRLPETLRATLQCVNGGAFVGDGQPHAYGNGEPGSRAACELLSAGQIERAYFDLIAIKESHIELDGWEHGRPDRPRLRLPGGSNAVCPSCPAPRPVVGGELLVLEVLDGNRSNRVHDAFHETSPREWGVLYDRYIDFIEDYVATGGYVRVISSGPVPGIGA